MSGSTADPLSVLRPAPAGTTLLITIGNTLRADDGVGPYIASALGSGIPGYAIQDAGEHPENALEPAVAARPAKVVMIDAADFGGRPGEARVLDRESLPQHSLSTHTFPLPVIAGLLERDTGAEVYFLGIQPRVVDLGEALSPAVRRTADRIVDYVRKAANRA